MFEVIQNNEYDWIVVGGGISGISIAEILSRESKSVLLLEKNDFLASETSKIFHEWLHTGALYTLVPDRQRTLKYMIGAIDDLLEYYSSFSKMNLIPTMSGLEVSGSGWFNNDPITFKYKKRITNPVWTPLVSKSISLVEEIKQHDWLRRRAGAGYGDKTANANYWFKNIVRQFKEEKNFLSIESSDLTMNSRVLIDDLISHALKNNLSVKTGCEVTNVNDKVDYVEVKCKDAKIYRAKNIVITAPDVLSKFVGSKIKIGYAPIHIVENIDDNENNFVELDIKEKNCINLLKKGSGVGQAGGVTVSNKNDIDSYSKYIISEHKRRNPNIKSIGRYVGLKKELVGKNENRNYLYHINQHNDKIWSTVLGKFTLSFSMAPEFYRRVYGVNPSKIFKINEQYSESGMIDKTAWQDIVENHQRKG